MKQIEKYITPFIQEQFPDFYKEDGNMLIVFTKAYYEWLENNLQEILVEGHDFSIGDILSQGDAKGKIISKYNSSLLVQLETPDPFQTNKTTKQIVPITNQEGFTASIINSRRFNNTFLSRNILDYRDIDYTLDQFIIFFKNKYLANIQFTTASNKELFIKNSLDFYRSKGTERAVDLFFKLIHGFEARVYTPGKDIFKLSDNEWVRSEYLEIEPSPTNIQFVGQRIIGSKSKATAFVERLIRVKKDTRYITVLYIATRDNDFITGEQITTTTLENQVTTMISGSLSGVEVLSSTPGFNDNDLLYPSSENGKGAVVKVIETANYQGIVRHDLNSGGWGYSLNSQVISSDVVFITNDLQFTDQNFHYHTSPFQTFEEVKQNLCYVSFSSNTNLGDYDEIQLKNSLGTLISNGIVSSKDDDGNFIINFVTDNDVSDFYYVTKNNVDYQINTISDISATANVIGSTKDSKIEYIPISNEKILQRGDILYQDDGYSRFASAVVRRQSYDEINNKYSADIEYTKNFFRTNLPFYNERYSDEYFINKTRMTFGVHDETLRFYEGYLKGSNTNSIAYVTPYRYQEKSIIEIESFKNLQTVDNYTSDIIIENINGFSSSSYTNSLNIETGFSNPTIDTLVNFGSRTIGTVNRFIERNLGSGYPLNPFYIIYDPNGYHLERYDYIIEFEDMNKFFSVGDNLIGSTSGAKGFVTKVETNKLFVTRTSIASNLTTSSDFAIGETITNQNNISTTISNVYERRDERRVSLNADLKSEAFFGEGFITELEVINSGFGYTQNEFLEFENGDKIALGKANIKKQGRGAGYHVNRKSFLSSDKYIQDSNYYQEYSYEILTSLPFDVYKDTIKKVLHVAGTKVFGSYVGTTYNKIDLDIRSDSTIITSMV